MVRRVAIVLSCLFFSGCASSDIMLQEPIAAGEISKVLTEIKRQLYIYKVRVSRLHVGQLSADQGEEWQRRKFRCGEGSAKISVKSLTVTLSTTTERSEGVSAKGTLPTAVPVSLSLAGSLGQSNSQELVLTLYPANIEGGALKDEGPAPIADQLVAVRDAMIITGTSGGECLQTDGPEAKNSYLIGIKVTHSESGEIGVALAPVNLGLSGSNKSVTGNQILVAFKGDRNILFSTPFDLKLNAKTKGIDAPPSAPAAQ